VSTLYGVQPALIVGEAKLAQLAAARGWAYTINGEEGGGYVRTPSDTAAYLTYRADEYATWSAAWKRAHPGKAPVSIYQWRPIAPFGGSMHNYGAAFDITPVRGSYEDIASLAPQAGLRSGLSASFVAARRVDPPHYELPISLLEAKARWLAMGKLAGVRSLPTATTAVALLAVVVLGGAAVAIARGLPTWR
jgi:hypothetical protein